MADTVLPEVDQTFTPMLSNDDAMDWDKPQPNGSSWYYNYTQANNLGGAEDLPWDGDTNNAYTERPEDGLNDDPLARFWRSNKLY